MTACTHDLSKVINSRLFTVNGQRVIKRRRKCLTCGHRWTTHEIYEDTGL